ncbi:MAG: class I SAM-dependent methyltransferase [Candidatus Sumerlaeota bacterium]|nr:class I SAM-dependent methyltransferase [Candidatus Sumerlaeota bacterium]
MTLRTSGLKAMIQNRLRREAIYSTPEYWDSKASEYAADEASMWPNRHLNVLYHRELLEAIRAYVPASRNVRVLDLGCGTGRLSGYFADQGLKVKALDFSRKAIEIARKRLGGKGISFEVCSLFDIQNKQEFELIFTWGVLTFACKDAEALKLGLAKLYTALKPGGKMLLLEPVHRGFLHRVLNMNVLEFKRIVTQTGFELLATEDLHFSPVRLLAYLPWPAFITRPLYWTGQALMRLPGMRGMGDYKLLFAEKMH